MCVCMSLVHVYTHDFCRMHIKHSTIEIKRFALEECCFTLLEIVLLEYSRVYRTSLPTLPWRRKALVLEETTSHFSGTEECVSFLKFFIEFYVHAFATT